MLWGRVRHRDRVLFGTVENDSVRVHAGDLFAGATPTGETIPLAELEWLTPCQPTKLIGLWNNFRAAAEKNGWAIPAEPLWFIKAPNSYRAHLQPVEAPASYDGRVFYEGELGVVIGKRCKAATEADAVASIFGYTCVNDVTAFEIIGRDGSFAQWCRAKSFDGFGPFGPVIATGIDPAGLAVRTLVNGRERQNYPVADMIFKPAELVARISQDMTLEPGDVIACGTSVGVLPLKPGTTVEVAIDGIGVLRNEYR